MCALAEWFLFPGYCGTNCSVGTVSGNSRASFIDCMTVLSPPVDPLLTSTEIIGRQLLTETIWILYLKKPKMPLALVQIQRGRQIRALTNLLCRQHHRAAISVWFCSPATLKPLEGIWKFWLIKATSFLKTQCVTMRVECYWILKDNKTDQHCGKQKKLYVMISGELEHII